MMVTKKWFLVLALSICLVPQAVQAAPEARTLYTNSVRPFAKDVRNLGKADPQAVVTFQVALSMRDLPTLRSRIAAGEVLSTEEMTSNYFPLEADYQSLIVWLQSQGLNVVHTYPNHLTVEVTGTVAQVRSTLKTEFQRVVVNHEEYVATDSTPQLPGEFARFVLGVNGLQPYLQAFPLSRQVEPQSPSTPFVPPYSTNDLLTAYSALNLGVTGAGQKTAVIIDRFPKTSDLTLYWANNGVLQSLDNIEFITVNGRVRKIPTGEESLDVELSSSIAPGSKVRIYGTGSLSFANIDNAFQMLINDLPSQPSLHQLSISLGSCETSNSTSQLQTDSQFLATIASAGVTTYVSSGDSGSAQCGSGAPGVSYFASDPSVAAIGGTSLTLNSTGAVTSETGWTGSGGGSSAVFARPSWQVGAGVPSGTTRVLPDVSAVADPATGVYVILRGKVVQFGGTSASAPIWAGFGALLNEARANAGKSPLGLLGPHVYPLLGTASFRDITAGSNGAFSAAPAYDLVTGIGVPIVNVLLPALVSQP